MLVAFQVGDYATAHAHDVRRCDGKHVVPRAGRSPHEIINTVILQQIWIYEHAQLCAVIKGRHAAIGLGNPGQRPFTSNPALVP